MATSSTTSSSSEEASTPFPEKDRISVCGYSLHLPGDITTGEQLFEVIKRKQQMGRDVVEGKRYPASLVDEEDTIGNPWKLKSRYCNMFTDQEVESYDCHFFRVTQKLAKFMDIRQVGCLQSVWSALEDAGIPAQRIYRTRTGIFAAGYVQVEHCDEAPDETTLRGKLMSSLADHISFFLGTHGPSLTLETACSSSLVALAMAVAALRKGDCDYAIVVSVNIPQDKDFHLSLQACGVLSTTGTSHPFDDAGPKGYVRAEGYGAIVLRRMSDSLNDGDRILCSIRNAVAGSAGAVEGMAEGAGRMYESPCVWGMKQLMTKAYEGAGISPSKVSYMECHATGTYVGDVLELQAIGEVLGKGRQSKNTLRIASVKSNIGHAEVSAGLFSLAKVIEMLRHRVYLPTAGVTTPRTDFDWRANAMRVIQESEPFPKGGDPILMGVNSFGIGGSYAHVVVEESRQAAAASRSTDFASPLVFPLSAVSEEHLHVYARNLAAFLKAKPGSDLRDVCGTMGVNRTVFKYKKPVIAKSVAELGEKLEALANGATKIEAPADDRRKRILFVFTGQGSQWVGCGETLMALPAYREAALQVDELFKALSGWSILEKSRTLSVEELRDTMYAQPVTFLIQVGLTKLLESFGLFPTMVVGHSAGEVGSAYASGFLTLEEAVQVVYYRSAEQQKLAGSGRLLAVGLSHAEASEQMETNFINDVEIACVNSSQSMVLAGSEETLQKLKRALPEGTFASFVPGNIAFHSSHVEPILPEIRRRLSFLDDEARGLHRDASSAPIFVSTVTGEESSVVNAEYWCENVRRTVLFEQAIEYIFEDEETAPDLVLEIGPHKTLAGPLLQIVRGLGCESPLVLPTLKRGEECVTIMTQLIAELFEKGVNLDLSSFYLGLDYRQIDIPKHPFIKSRMHNTISVHRLEKWAGMYMQGPIAGSSKAGAFEVEVCDRTFKQLCDHKMGGQEIAPGCFYVEMAIEAVGVPCTLTNVEFKSMCKIPKSTAGELATLVSCKLEEVEGDEHAHSFQVRSCPAEVRVTEVEEPLTFTEHCVGYALKEGLLTPEGKLDPNQHLRPQSFGLPGPLALKDIGKAGLEALKKRHATCLAGSREQFYGIVNKEGISEYGPSFQVVTSLYGNMVEDTFLGTLEFDSQAWIKKGGHYGYQLLDGLYQIPFLLPSYDPQIVAYAGGFEAAYFVRNPTNKLYAFLRSDSKAPYHGRKKYGGSYEVYDEEGSLILYMKNIFCIYGASTDTTQLCDLVWQPRVSTPNKAFIAEVEAKLRTTTTSPSSPIAVESIAEVFAKTASSFHQSCGHATVFRILEIAQDSSIPCIAEALSRMDLGTGHIIEVFVGSHDIQVLNMIAGSVGRTVGVLRVRKILLPAMPRELADLAFDAVVFHDWHATGKAGWSKGPDDPVTNAMNALSTFMSPQAQIMVCGLKSEVNDDAEMWLEKVQPFVSECKKVDLSPSSTFILAQAEPVLPAAARTHLVITENVSLANSLTGHLTHLAGAQCKTKVVTCGGSSAQLQDSVSGTAWGSVLQGVLDDLPSEAGFQGIVFLAGLEDKTVLGTEAFGRLTKLCQAASICEASIAALMGGNGKEALLWVVTEGAYGGQIRSNQGTIQGLTFVIAHELPAMEARLIDMGGKASEAIAKVAKVLAYSPREKVYLVSEKEGIQVPRYFPLDIKSIRSTVVSPESSTSYFCDVSTALSTPGQISVDFQTVNLPPPGENQVTVDIHAAALNFRDVLIAINMLPELSYEGSYYGRHLGMEAAGVISAIGKGVTHLKVGDRVATAEASCFANRLIAPAERVVKLIDSISFEVAASTQSVYNTARHALINIARIKKGDRVLVHAAAGGVGHAAISVCQHVGAIIYATASVEKRAAVRAMGVEHIYDSRSMSWFAEIMRDTNNRGMDAVLNSLAGKHQQLGVQVLAPGGRFLEIGKLDIYDNRKIGLLALRKNALFTAIDMDRLALDDPVLTIKTTAEVFELLGRGDYPPIPATIFTMDKICNAIDLIKAGKHMGKVVLTNYTTEGVPVPVRVQVPQRIFHSNATYLITGGAGGFGSKIVRSAFEKGARHFVITVTKEPERVAALFHDIIKTPGCTVDVKVADTAKEEDMAELVRFANSRAIYPLKAVFHVAGISMDTVLSEVKTEDLLKVGGCKSLGAWHLHNHTKDLPLETFVVISSVASLMGGRGRAAYSSSNALMDALIRHRRQLGLPGTAFNMTSLSDVGILAQNIPVRQMQLRSNVEFVQSFRALQDLEDAIECNVALGCELFFRENAVGVYPNRASFLHGGKNQFTLGADVAKAGDRTLTLKEVQTLIADTIKAIAGHKEVLGSSALFSVGMDSFSTVELISRIKQFFGVEMNPSKIGPATTVADLSKLVYAMQAGAKGESSGTTSTKAETAAAGAGSSSTAAKEGPAQPPKKARIASAPARLAVALPKTRKISPPRPIKKVQEASVIAMEATEIDDDGKLGVIQEDHVAEPGDAEVLQMQPTGCLGFVTGRRPTHIPAMDRETALKWLITQNPLLSAKKRLVCFPWGGGTVRAFDAWRIKDTEIVTMNKPGLDSRQDEKDMLDIRLIAANVVKALNVLGYLGDKKPLCFYGHSFGTYVALECAHLLKDHHRFTIDHLYLASTRPPHTRFPLWWYSIAPLFYVRLLLAYYGGLPQEFRDCSSMSGQRIVRNCQRDLGAMDFYSCRTDKHLDCPITVMYGSKDILTPSSVALGWKDFTNQELSIKLFEGHKHLFCIEKECVPKLVDYLQASLLAKRGASAS